MSQHQLLLEHKKLSVSQILRIYGKQFKQITERYSDGNNGRCALGVIMSYFGWDGREDFDTARWLLGASDVLKNAGTDYGLLIDLNDFGMSFDEIADYLDRTNELTSSK
jgi:hypothetical protein